MEYNFIKRRKYLSADGLFKEISEYFKKIPDIRKGKIEIKLSDVLMAAFAMFSLKNSSLLGFNRRKELRENLEIIYHIGSIPDDYNMRKIIDKVDTSHLKPIFNTLFKKLQRGNILKKFVFLDQYYLLSLDGTGYFSSNSIHCENCMQKNLKGGKKKYYHQILGAVLMHPQQSSVIPFAPELIVKQDGTRKNDCERNAAKRFIARLRKDHPKLKMIIVEDGISSNAPHIKNLQENNLRFILGVKPGDHKFLFEYIDSMFKQGKGKEFEQKEQSIIHRYRYLNKVPLNKSNQDLLVNFLEYWQIEKGETIHFTWVTDFRIKKDNCYELMRGARARWKIEDETFNTLKNQGYNFEHNYGHGKKHLSENFALLMMLAFLVDQIQMSSCELFRRVLEKEECKTDLWESIRSIIKCFSLLSMQMVYETLFYGFEKVNPLILREKSLIKII